jgi:hypothetical protein
VPLKKAKLPINAASLLLLLPNPNHIRDVPEIVVVVVVAGVRNITAVFGNHSIAGIAGIIILISMLPN